MLREPVRTDNAPAPIGPYSQAMRAEGRFLFLSGQAALRLDGTMVNGTPAEDAEQCLKNLDATLAAAGLTFANVVKVTIMLQDMEAFAEVNEVYARYVGMPAPARSTFAAAGLPKNTKVEIEAIAVY